LKSRNELVSRMKFGNIFDSSPNVRNSSAKRKSQADKSLSEMLLLPFVRVSNPEKRACDKPIQAIISMR
jgi:hypothetical protein